MKDSGFVPLDQMLLSYPRVDYLKIEELKSFDSTGVLFTELVNIFYEEFKINLPLLESHLQTGKLVELSQLAHRLRSTGYNSGASRVSEILKRIELDAKDQDVKKSEIQVLVNSLEVETGKTYVELKKLT